MREGGEGAADDFGCWVGPHLPAMAALATRMVGASDRDDIVQEALTRAWRRRTTFDPERGSPKTWLLAIVSDRARRHWGRRPQLVPVPEPQRRDTATSVDIERALATLSRRQRLAVDLYYFLDLDVRDTASVMRCSIGTVKSTLSDARTRLRPLLEA